MQYAAYVKDPANQAVLKVDKCCTSVVRHMRLQIYVYMTCCSRMSAVS